MFYTLNVFFNLRIIRVDFQCLFKVIRCCRIFFSIVMIYRKIEISSFKLRKPSLRLNSFFCRVACRSLPGAIGTLQLFFSVICRQCISHLLNNPVAYNTQIVLRLSVIRHHRCNIIISFICF